MRTNTFFWYVWSTTSAKHIWYARCLQKILPNRPSRLVLEQKMVSYHLEGLGSSIILRAITCCQKYTFQEKWAPWKCHTLVSLFLRHDWLILEILDVKVRFYKAHNSGENQWVSTSTSNIISLFKVQLLWELVAQKYRLLKYNNCNYRLLRRNKWY